MKKHLLIILTVIACSITKAQTGIVDSTTAVLAANNYYSQKTSQSFSITNVYTIKYNNHPSRYLINYSPNGFIMMSASYNINPYLGYSLQGQLDTTNMSPELASWLNNYDLIIDTVITYNVSDSTTIAAAATWASLLNNAGNNNADYRTAFGTGFFLLQTLWNQTNPYNQQCPVDNGGCNPLTWGSTNCPTGCVATAMAQIMKYWNFAHGGSFDWCNMPKMLQLPPDPTAVNGSPQVSIDAVANLMATLGNSGNLNMDYCQSSKCQSGATVYTSTSNHTAYDVFQNYGYFATHIKKSVFWDTHQTTTNFLNPIRAELDANRPVLFAGESAVILPKEAHCWVCDGYDVHGDINAFHFNFGWGGSGDGVWYYISNINPSGDDFNSGEEVILVQPDYDYIVDCNSSVNVTTNFPFSWTAGTVFNSGSFTAVTGSDLTYTAYNEVKLSNGFRAEPGSNFRATTAPCPNPNCPNPPPDFRTSNQQGNNTTASNTTGGRGSTGAVTPKATAVQSKLGTNIKLGIFPNPTSGVVYLNLSAQSAGSLLVNISDLNGNQLLHNSFEANAGANSFKVDLGSLNQGVYFINVTDENGVTLKNDKLVLMPN